MNFVKSYIVNVRILNKAAPFKIFEESLKHGTVHSCIIVQVSVIRKLKKLLSKMYFRLYFVINCYFFVFYWLDSNKSVIKPKQMLQWQELTAEILYIDTN